MRRSQSIPHVRYKEEQPDLLRSALQAANLLGRLRIYHRLVPQRSVAPKRLPDVVIRILIAVALWRTRQKVEQLDPLTALCHPRRDKLGRAHTQIVDDHKRLAAGIFDQPAPGLGEQPGVQCTVIDHKPQRAPVGQARGHRLGEPGCRTGLPTSRPRARSCGHSWLGWTTRFRPLREFQHPFCGRTALAL